MTEGEKAVITVVAAAAGVLLRIGFICGYAVRALISRLHRAKARRRRFERVAEEVAKTRKLIAVRPEARLAIGYQSGDGAQAPPEGGAS
jgi:hypothetical protein